MNAYDKAHDLARSLKESQEYKEYAKIKAEVSLNPELSDMLNNFQEKQYALQAQQMMGQDFTPGMMEQVQELMQIIMRDPLAAQYVQAQMIFSKLVADIYGILGEVIKFDQD